MEGVGRLGMLLIRTQIMVKRLKCYWNKFKYCSYYVPCKPRVGKGNLSASFKRVFTRSCYIQRFRCRPGRFWDRTFYFSVLGAKFLGSVSITSYWKKPYRGQESVCASLHEKHKIPVESASFVCLSVCVLLYPQQWAVGVHLEVPYMWWERGSEVHITTIDPSLVSAIVNMNPSFMAR